MTVTCDCRIDPDNFTEIAFHNYLLEWNIGHAYEIEYAGKKPDFTLYDQQGSIKVVLDIKDMNLSAVDSLKLRTVGLVRNPSKKTRQKIGDVKEQFRGVGEYPCILLIASGDDRPPNPESLFAAMVGDMKIDLEINYPSDTMNVHPVYRGNRKMSPESNARISAIGSMSNIRPGESTSGYLRMIGEYSNKYLSNGRYDKKLFIHACAQLKEKLTKEGHDLESFDIQIDYVLNPYSKNPFPRDFLQKGYAKIWEIDEKTGSLTCTYDWERGL